MTSETFIGIVQSGHKQDAVEVWSGGPGVSGFCWRPVIGLALVGLGLGLVVTALLFKRKA